MDPRAVAAGPGPDPAPGTAPGADPQGGPGPGPAAPSPDLRDRIAAAYRAACLLELEALKPGNVHRYGDGHGMTVGDFVRSAHASAGPLTEPGLRLGERIYRAVAATRETVGCNTNLGILLLCGPLIQATLDGNGSAGLETRLAQVLAGAGRADTDGLYRAIRLAAPGGLGTSPSHDVRAPATGTPLEVMSLAAPRDRIALQYATGYADLLWRAVPLLVALERRWQDHAWAAAGLYMDFLGRYPDTHIARKAGARAALAIARQAAPLTRALLESDRPEGHAPALLALDRRLKESGTNPGTCADLTVACLLIRGLLPVRATRPGQVLPVAADGRP